MTATQQSPLHVTLKDRETAFSLMSRMAAIGGISAPDFGLDIGIPFRDMEPQLTVYGRLPYQETRLASHPLGGFSKDNSALYCSFNTDLSPASFLESFAIWAHFVRIRSMTSTTNRADSAAPGVCKVLSLWVSPKSTTVFAPKNNGF